MNKSNHLLKLTVFLAVFLVFIFSFNIKESRAASKKGLYQIRINRMRNTVTIYKLKKNKKGKKKYVAIRAMICSTGSGTPYSGTFRVGAKYRWHALNGNCCGQYCSRITPHILFHSVWYYKYAKNTQSYRQYNRLGTAASHGCIRLTVYDAKWIYDNCPTGTKIIIYNSKKAGPLGKPKFHHVSGFMGWDPTDPDPSNPYMKKQPKIKGAKSRTLKYGAKYKVKKGIKAKNSFGKNVTKRIKIKIKYKAIGKKKYKSVKKVNTKKPGIYKVTYSISDILHHKKKKTITIKVKDKKRNKVNNDTQKVASGAGISA